MHYWGRRVKPTVRIHPDMEGEGIFIWMHSDEDAQNVSHLIIHIFIY